MMPEKNTLPPLPALPWRMFASSDVAALLHARDRQIVELCAAIVESEMPQNDRSDWTEYAQTRAEALTEAAAAIRSLVKGGE
jgi:hypothetical protein